MSYYSINGNLTYTESDETEDGLKEITIDEQYECDADDCSEALEKFLQENSWQYNFFGSLKTCDSETYGKKGATFRDDNENQTIEIELIDED